MAEALQVDAVPKNNNKGEEGSDDASDADFDDDDYYNSGEAEYYAAGDEGEGAGPSECAADPESFDYCCLSLADVERLLSHAVDSLAVQLPVTGALAKALLHAYGWSVEALVERYGVDSHRLLVDARVRPPAAAATTAAAATPRSTACAVCARTGLACSELLALACQHQFCRQCWLQHVDAQLLQGVAAGVECMEASCRVLAQEDFVLKLLSCRTDLRAKYQKFVFQDHVKSHPELRFCPGANCSVVIRGQSAVGKRVVCDKCKLSFCFRCGNDYHAPTGCETIKRWLTKCADDSETANYISAHTKDCPACHACIEKNGGCNHMHCAKCKHHFCWMCLGDWKSHGSEYYECSKYRDNPNIANEAVHVKARKALEKYLHYFERWENHAKSLQLEEELRQRIAQRIEQSVSEHRGTWIDWQYLYNAASLLTKCRYTLKYTYPFAYYLDQEKEGGRKDLFEYQQAQLEKEIEELSWKVEHADCTKKGEMETQMNIAEKKRLTLLQDFFDSS